MGTFLLEKFPKSAEKQYTLVYCSYSPHMALESSRYEDEKRSDPNPDLEARDFFDKKFSYDQERLQWESTMGYHQARDFFVNLRRDKDATGWEKLRDKVLNPGKDAFNNLVATGTPLSFFKE
ncbi:MAG: hypothetical protein H6765_09025 [Candidatus Peribacteria bacterium]|nr:MAG: hypothetical protein H6765_09025 [Candidatus Peribacteria bacterium]